jgi:siroheme synthase
VIVVYMGLKHAGQIAEELMAAGRRAGEPVPS